MDDMIIHLDNAVESSEKPLQQIEMLLELQEWLSGKLHSHLICDFNVNAWQSIFISVQLSAFPRYYVPFNFLYLTLITGLHLLPFPINPPSLLESYITASTFLPDLIHCTRS